MALPGADSVLGSSIDTPSDAKVSRALRIKKYDHTVFKQDLTAFNAYDKAFFDQMIELETLM